MKKNKTTQGFGLAVFSLTLIGISFIGILSLEKCVIANIISILSVILATAAFFESRRARGPVKFTITALIISILGMLLVFSWTGTMKEFKFLPREPEKFEIIIDSNKNDALKMIEKAEELETDSLK